MGSCGTLHLRNTYVLDVPRPYPCTPMVTYSNDKYSKVLLGPIVSLQLVIDGADEHSS